MGLNAILLRSIKTQEDAIIISAFKSVYAKLKEKGHKPTLHVIANECSCVVKTYIASKKISIQIVAPDDHKVNAWEPVVKSTKYPVISTIATADESCPLQLRSGFLLQIQQTLNMLRTSQQNNSLTADKELSGPFDWHVTPMAPLGNSAAVFIAPDNREMYAPTPLEYTSPVWPRIITDCWKCLS